MPFWHLFCPVALIFACAITGGNIQRLRLLKAIMITLHVSTQLANPHGWLKQRATLPRLAARRNCAWALLQCAEGCHGWSKPNWVLRTSQAVYWLTVLHLCPASKTWASGNCRSRWQFVLLYLVFLLLTRPRSLQHTVGCCGALLAAAPELLSCCCLQSCTRLLLFFGICLLAQSKACLECVCEHHLLCA